MKNTSPNGLVRLGNLNVEDFKQYNDGRLGTAANPSINMRTIAPNTLGTNWDSRINVEGFTFTIRYLRQTATAGSATLFLKSTNPTALIPCSHRTNIANALASPAGTWEWNMAATALPNIDLALFANKVVNSTSMFTFETEVHTNVNSTTGKSYRLSGMINPTYRLVTFSVEILHL